MFVPEPPDTWTTDPADIHLWITWNPEAFNGITLRPTDDGFLALDPRFELIFHARPVADSEDWLVEVWLLPVTDDDIHPAPSPGSDHWHAFMLAAEVALAEGLGEPDGTVTIKPYSLNGPTSDHPAEEVINRALQSARVHSMTGLAETVRNRRPQRAPIHLDLDDEGF